MSTTECISENKLEKPIINYLNNIAKNEGFMNHKKYIRTISTNGGNYLGELFEVEIKDEVKELNIFLKLIKSEITPDFLDAQVLQDREIFVYGELITLYTQLMNEAHIPENDRYKQAKYYGTIDNYIILENLADRGFQTLNRTTPLSFSFAESAIKQLAKFHALSFVLQTKNPKYFNKNVKVLKHAAKYTPEYFKAWDGLVDIACDLLDENSEKRVRAAYDIFGDVAKYYGDSSSPKCLCHGDFRSNNLLIKQANDTITELLPVDFQMIHFGNPMNDFWYLLIPHSDREFRRKHLTTLKELYYDTLTQFLKYFDIDVSNVYPRKEFEVDYNQQKSFGLLIGIGMLSFLFSKEDAIIKMSEMNSMKSKVKLQDVATDRIRGIIADYIEWGII